MLQIERRPEHVDSVEIIRDKIVHRSDGQVDEEVVEVKKDKRRWFPRSLPPLFLPFFSCCKQASKHTKDRY